MSAWTKLLAASSLAIGTAWELISSPRTGGTGVVVNNGAVAVIDDSALAVAIADAGMTIALADNRMAVTVADSQISTTFAPGITVQITTQPIGATA